MAKMNAGSGGRVSATKRRGALRRGLTTGTCAAAAAKAAAASLLSGRPRRMVDVILPGGERRRRLHVSVRFLTGRRSSARVASSELVAEATVIKDGGDDPDVTHGARICAVVSLRPADENLRRLLPVVGGLRKVKRAKMMPDLPGVDRVELYGGRGVGIVTRPGLPVPPGEPAINPVPRSMIAQAVLKVIPEDRVATIAIFVPDGARLAHRTMNPRLGIIEGISILGTTGIVEPMSHAAVEATIDMQISIAAAEGSRNLVLTPGRKGEKWAADILRLDQGSIVQVGNAWGHALESCRRHGIDEVLLIGHPAKLAKIAAGAASTHSRDVPVPFDMLAELAVSCGATKGVADDIRAANTVEQIIPLISGGDETTGGCASSRFFSALTRAIIDGARRFTGDRVRLGVALYDRAGEVLWAGSDSRPHGSLEALL